jgi:glycine dehydrogenase
MEALINFQTMCADLTGMEIANASLLDEGTAAAEAMTLAKRSAKSKSNVFFVSSGVHPQTVEVLRTRAEPLDIELVIGDDAEAHSIDSFGVLLQYPNTFGQVHDYQSLADAVHARGGLVAVATDLLALTLIAAPGEWGADIVVGNTQRFGVPYGFGGPHAAFMACRDAYKRSMPGRLIGVSVDAEGKPAYRLTLQTREQHIRREKATSNICTAQVLLAVMASMYAVYHGPEGLTRIARRVHRLATILAGALRQAGLTVGPDFFDTLHVLDVDAAAIHAKAEAARINLRRIDGRSLGISLDETTTRADVVALAALFGASITDIDALDAATADALPAGLKRTGAFLTHPVFNTHHSEHELLRYMRALADKDLAMDRTMIPLGSCTMKLNATAEMIPVTWPEFGNLHPLAPAAQARGYKELIDGLEAMLVECTGYDAVSLQPNSGAQGEYAGLLAIRAYHRFARRRPSRHLPDPESAHGTNPASAQMCGMQVVVTKCDSNGNVDVEDIQRAAEKYSERLAALMITYPSTHGVFEEDVVRICEIVHAHGGQVYTDGANMNALVGVAKPGKWGSDVSHLNLHKTFCIPHGGGGPGVGPCAVKSHLAPFLPRTLRRATGSGHGLGGELRFGLDPADQLDVRHADGQRRPAQGHAGRAAQRQLHRQAPGAALRDALHRPQRPGRARVHPRPASAQGQHRRVGRGRGQAPDRLRLPRADVELPGRRHADGGTDRERIAARARPLHQRDDRDPRGDPRHRGRQARPRGQPAQERPAHRDDGGRQRVDPRLPARAGRVPAAGAEAAEVLAAGGARRQRLRRQERHVRVHPGGCVQGRRGRGVRSRTIR